jgi:hypothetical protein
MQREAVQQLQHWTRLKLARGSEGGSLSARPLYKSPGVRASPAHFMPRANRAYRSSVPSQVCVPAAAMRAPSA